jgi:hypothetical protein
MHFLEPASTIMYVNSAIFGVNFFAERYPLSKKQYI